MAPLSLTRKQWANGIALVLLLAGLIVTFGLDVCQRDALSWMDPYQYYGFAGAVLNRRVAWNQFELPSVFPFCLLPFLALNRSIASALWVNAVFTVILGIGVHRLCLQLRLTTPSVLVVAAVLTSPLLVGLSRELYVEFALSALVAVAFVFWLRMLRSGLCQGRLAVAFLLGLGLMMKMTFPVFFLAPAAGAMLAYLFGKQYRSAGRLALVVVAPAGVVLCLQYTVFPDSFRYYTSLGDTTLPIMSLIGPGGGVSWPASTYYYLLVPKYLLGCLTVFLAAALLRGVKAARGLGWRDLTGEAAQLGLWFLGPLTLLALEPVKEPRHVAPAIVPAVLIAFWGLEGVRRPALRVGLLALAIALAGCQYLAVTQGVVRAPYYLRGPLHLAEVEDQMRRSSPQPAEWRDLPPAVQRAAWAYDQNVAIVGFEPNAALALTWHFFPAVVFDLDVVSARGCSSRDEATSRFEDLFILSGLSTYNRRIGACRYYQTLSAEQVVDAADFILVQDNDADPVSASFPHHELLARVEAAGGPVRILKAKRPSSYSYRTLYAREYLRRNPGLSSAEQDTVAVEQMTSLTLRGQFTEADGVLAAHPDLQDAQHSTRNIYWIGQYQMIQSAAGFLYREHLSKN